MEPARKDNNKIALYTVSFLGFFVTYSNIMVCGLLAFISYNTSVVVTDISLCPGLHKLSSELCACVYLHKIMLIERYCYNIFILFPILGLSILKISCILVYMPIGFSLSTPSCCDHPIIMSLTPQAVVGAVRTCI